MAVAAVLALVFSASAFAKPHTIRAGNLFLMDDGGISPSKLPKHEPGPGLGPYRREDRDHRRQPPARGRDPEHRLRQDHPGERQGPAGLQAGKARGPLRPPSREEGVPRRDRRLRRGRGRSRLPRTGAVRRQGPHRPLQRRSQGRHHALFVHAYVAVPAPTAVVARVRLTRINRGHYGIHTVSEIPKIAGGAGSVTAFRIAIDRRFTSGVERELPDGQLSDRDLLHRREIQFTDGNLR